MWTRTSFQSATPSFSSLPFPHPPPCLLFPPLPVPCPPSSPPPDLWTWSCPTPTPPSTASPSFSLAPPWSPPPPSSFHSPCISATRYRPSTSPTPSSPSPRPSPRSGLAPSISSTGTTGNLFPPPSFWARLCPFAFQQARPGGGSMWDGSPLSLKRLGPYCCWWWAWRGARGGRGRGWVGGRGSGTRGANQRVKREIESRGEKN